MSEERVCMYCYYVRLPGKAIMPASSSLVTAKVAMQQLEPQSTILVLIALGCGYNRRRVGPSYSLSVRVVRHRLRTGDAIRVAALG
jgi:hypothetical protein